MSDFAAMWHRIGQTAAFVAAVSKRARRGAVALSVHRMKYGYEPRWEIDEAGAVRILDCSLPGGACPPRPWATGENVIARALREAGHR